MPVINRYDIKAITPPYTPIFFQDRRARYLLTFFSGKIIANRPCHCIFAMQIRASSIHGSLPDGRLHHLGNLATPIIYRRPKVMGRLFSHQILAFKMIMWHICVPSCRINALASVVRRAPSSSYLAAMLTLYDSSRHNDASRQLKHYYS